MALKLKNIEKHSKNYILKLKINNDYTKAYLEIFIKQNEDDKKFQEQEQFPNIQDISSFLQENGIVFGIDINSMENIVNKKITKATLIASGSLPIKGEDARIIYNYDFSKKINLIQDKDGNIDFKSLNWFKQIKKGEVIAIKKPAQKGTDGINIKNEPIIAQEGKDIAFKFGKNVEENKDKMTIIASKDGVLEIIDAKVIVNEVLKIDGDIDTSTGNIDFIGDIFVSGDIKTGFKVEASGSLQVDGVIEASDIKVGKDLIVKGGIQGNEITNIVVKGSLVCKFIENANIFSYSDINSDFIIHSNVKSGGKIILNGAKSLIVGGEVTAKDSIVSSIIGSSMGTKTSIILGVDVEKEELMLKKQNDIELLYKEINKISPVIEIGKEMLQRGKMDTIRKIAFTKSMKQYNDTLDSIKNIKEEIDRLENEMRQFRFSHLTVKEKIYPGVKITILKNSRNIKDFIDNCKIYLKGNEIAIEKGYNL